MQQQLHDLISLIGNLQPIKEKDSWILESDDVMGFSVHDTRQLIDKALLPDGQLRDGIDVCPEK